MNSVRHISRATSRLYPHPYPHIRISLQRNFSAATTPNNNNNSSSSFFEDINSNDNSISNINKLCKGGDSRYLEYYLKNPGNPNPNPNPNTNPGNILDLSIPTLIKPNFPHPISQISYGGRIFNYSGDDDYSHELIEYLRNNGNFIDLTPFIPNSNQIGPILKDYLNNHDRNSLFFSIDINRRGIEKYVISSSPDRETRREIDFNIDLTQYLSHIANLFGLQYIDIAILNDVDLEEDISDRYNYIGNMMKMLESARAADYIKQYGIDSKYFGLDPSMKNFLSIEKIVSIAKNIGKNTIYGHSHFTTIRFPINIIENNILYTINQHENMLTTIEEANIHKLFLWGRAALFSDDSDSNNNSIDLRLISWKYPRSPDPNTDETAIAHSIVKELKETWNYCIFLETIYPDVIEKGKTELKTQLIHNNPNNLDIENLPVPSAENLTFAHAFAAQANLIGNIDSFQYILYNTVLPNIKISLELLNKIYSNINIVKDWANRYNAFILRLFNIYNDSLIITHYHQSKQINSYIESIQPKLSIFPLLEEKCIILIAAAGIHSILIDRPQIWIKLNNYTKIQYEKLIPQQILSQEEALKCLKSISEFIKNMKIKKKFPIPGINNDNNNNKNTDT